MTSPAPVARSTAAAMYLHAVDQYNNLPDDQREALVDDHSGELHLFRHYWEQSLTWTGATLPDGLYDATDAAYLLLAFAELAKEHGRPLTRPLLHRLWDMSMVSAVTLLSVLNFEDDCGYDWGVFAYEHLDPVPGSIPAELYSDIMCDTNSESLADLTKGTLYRVAQAKGLPVMVQEHSHFTKDMWSHFVMNGNTGLPYADWLKYMLGS